jgi:hypothetical protein
MNRPRAILLGALAVALLTPSVSESQTPAAERAVRAVVDSFFHLIDREKWDSAAALVDAARFEPFLRQQISQARVELPQPDPTVESMMAMDSTMPRAVAEWQVQQMKKYRRPDFGDRSDMFAGVHTQHELFALTPAQALSRWIEAKDERTQRRRSMLMQNCPPQALEAIMSFPAPKHVVLAVAIQDDTSAFAIHSTAGAGSFRIPEMLIGGEMIMSLHKQAAVWKIDPRGDLMRPLNSGGVWYGCPEIKKKD